MRDLPNLPIRRVSRLDLIADDWPWPFAIERRDDIAAHFIRLRADKPALWNGRVLLAREPRFTGETFHARYFETDFASFMFWRDLGFPDRSVVNGFGMGALCGSDGGFILGEMAAHTANGGKVYFPSGTPDRSDLRDGRVDMAGSVAREVQEETGLSPDEYAPDAFWHVVACDGCVAMIQKLRLRQSTSDVRRKITSFITTQPDPELSAVHAAYRFTDMSSAMPDFITAYLAAQFDDGSSKV